MLTCTITNLSSTASIGAGTSTPLPGAFSWITIVASGNATPVCRVQDLSAAAEKLSGFTVADELQKMVQMKLITCTFANLAATSMPDIAGDAVSNET